MNITPPDIVYYHKNCRDGFTAAWAVWKKYPSATFVPLSYGESVDLASLHDKNVLMVDVSLDRQEMIDINNASKNFQLIDHHKTAFEKLSGLPFVFFDMKRSGAGLAWDLVHPDQPRPMLINVVEDRDLWNWKISDSKAITTYLDTIPEDFDAYNDFELFLQTQPESVINHGKVMKDYHLHVSRFMSNDHQEIIHGDKRGLAVNVPHAFVSDVGNILAQKEGVDFVFLWSMLSDGSIRASWRSAKPVDDLARDFGGGGHPLACGATMDTMTLLSYLSGSHDPKNHVIPQQPFSSPPKPKSCC